jgi:Tfp pilus assembly protein PilO
MWITSQRQELKLIGWLAHGVGAVGLVVLACAAHRLILRPLGEETERTRARIQLIQTRLKDAATIRSEHVALSRSLEEITRRAELVRQRIPDQPQEAEFLHQLARIAADHGLLINNYRRGVVTTRDNYSQLTMQVQLEADYHGLCGLFHALKNLLRIVTVEKMELKADGTNPTYPVDLTFALFYGVQTTDERAKKVTHEPT